MSGQLSYTDDLTVPVVGDIDWTCSTFDDRGRITQATYPGFGGEPARTVTANWAVSGNPMVTSMSDAAGTVTTTFDLLGQTVGYEDVWGNVTAIDYDQAGQIVSQTSPAGAFSYAFDGGGQLAEVRRGGDVLANGLVYDTAGRLTNVIYPSGAGNAGNGTSGTFAFDTFGRPDTSTWNASDGTLLTSDDVMRAVGGRIVGQVVDGTDHHAGDDYVYDQAGRLTGAWVPGRNLTYGFASSGGCGPNPNAGKNTNRTSMTTDGGAAVTYCYDPADRLTSTTEAGVGTIAYDSHGNTTAILGEDHTYDAADRHIATEKDTTTVEYVRDVTDRIVERRVNGAIEARYGYTAAGDVSGLTLDGGGVLVEAIVALPGGALQTIRQNGSAWGYPNIHGDIVASASPSGTKSGSTVVYDPFGNVVSGGQPDNAAGAFDFGWEGQAQRPLEHETGLQSMIEMGARQYSPLLGRFLETDPIEGGSCNAYEYGCGDAVNNEDLDGRALCVGFVRVGDCRSKKQKLKDAFNRAIRDLRSTRDSKRKVHNLTSAQAKYAQTMIGLLSTAVTCLETKSASICAANYLAGSSGVQPVVGMLMNPQGYIFGMIGNVLNCSANSLKVLGTAIGRKGSVNIVGAGTACPRLGSRRR